MVDLNAVKKQLIEFESIVTAKWYVYPNIPGEGFVVRFHTNVEPQEFPNNAIQRFLADSPLIVKALIAEVELLQAEIATKDKRLNDYRNEIHRMSPIVGQWGQVLVNESYLTIDQVREGMGFGDQVTNWNAQDIIDKRNKALDD